MSAAPATAVEQEDVSIDAGRAFVGPNASFYDESWRQMLWRGRHWSWNPHAALFGPLWLAYRRMPLIGALALVGMHGLFMLHDRGWSFWLLMFLLGSAMLVMGFYANALYLAKFRQTDRSTKSASDSVLDHEQSLVRQGGVSPALAYTYAGMLTALIAWNLTH